MTSSKVPDMLYTFHVHRDLRSHLRTHFSIPTSPGATAVGRTTLRSTRWRDEAILCVSRSRSRTIHTRQMAISQRKRRHSCVCCFWLIFFKGKLYKWISSHSLFSKQTRMLISSWALSKREPKGTPPTGRGASSSSHTISAPPHWPLDTGTGDHTGCRNVHDIHLCCFAVRTESKEWTHESKTISMVLTGEIEKKMF